MYWFVYARVLECSRMAVCCRVCLSAVEPKHSTALFTAKGVELRWPERLTELLCVCQSAIVTSCLGIIYAARADRRWRA